MASDGSVTQCYSSSQEVNPWWMADLGGSKRVSHVKVRTSGSGTSSQFLSVEVRLGESPDHTNNPKVGHKLREPKLGAEVEFMPPEHMTGQYLSIQSLDSSPGNVLSICDVEILEMPLVR